MVFPVANYTEKISSGIRFTFMRSPHLTFTYKQIAASLERGYPWLINRDERQEKVFKKLINLYTKRLVQAGLVSKVKSNTTIDPQWMVTSAATESGYMNITGYDSVARTDEARKSVLKRPINRHLMRKLNQKTVASV